jgi:hypothetical protein
MSVTVYALQPMFETAADLHSSGALSLRQRVAWASVHCSPQRLAAVVGVVAEERRTI